MTAYAIGVMNVHDTAWQQAYGAAMPALIGKHGGKVLAKAPAQALEGAAAAPDVVVLIAFPTADHARAWYDDPDHAPLKQLRRSGADLELLLVDAPA